MNKQELLESAGKAAKQSYSPYSGFRVGAAILTESGKVFTGTNVENRSFGLTICAERSAAVTAVSAGEQKFTALAIQCPDAETPVSPCGACRQFISEFAEADMPIYFQDGTGHVTETTMSELHPFDALHNLKDSRA